MPPEPASGLPWSATSGRRSDCACPEQQNPPTTRRTSHIAPSHARDPSLPSDPGRREAIRLTACRKPDRADHQPGAGEGVSEIGSRREIHRSRWRSLRRGVLSPPDRDRHRCPIHYILFEHRSGSRLSTHYSATGQADFARWSVPRDAGANRPRLQSEQSRSSIAKADQRAGQFPRFRTPRADAYASTSPVVRAQFARRSGEAIA